MESLSPECTPLKQKYDGCFNAWFEGYLQPTLGNASIQQANPVTSPETPKTKSRIVTSWADAFKQREIVQAPTPSSEVHVPVVWESVETQGKTRAQIKAEEYDRNCGQAWTDYNACLKKAIGENPSLSVLLEQAREEHPLKKMDGQGPAWEK